MKKNEKLLLCLVALLPFSLHVKAEHAHTWSNWEVTCPATCNYEGVKIRYCTECYEEDAEDIPATGNTTGANGISKSPAASLPAQKLDTANTVTRKKKKTFQLVGITLGANGKYWKRLIA